MPELHNLKSAKYHPNRKFVRHRKLILRRMTESQMSTYESAMAKSRTKGRKVSKKLPSDAA